MVPGVVGLILTQIAVLLTAIAIVREKETRMFEALISTPVRPAEVIAGKVLPYFVLAAADAALVLFVGQVVFDVPMRGGYLLLFALLFFFVLGSLGVGILASTLTRTQIQAVFAGMIYWLPTIFFSGLFFPIEGMPKVLQYVTYLVPLRYFLEAARGIMLKGVGLEVLWLQSLVMVLFGTGTLFLATRLFRKQLA
jgi:ABC-2 type transport system permease protein